MRGCEWKPHALKWAVKCTVWVNDDIVDWVCVEVEGYVCVCDGDGVINRCVVLTPLPLFTRKVPIVIV